MRVASGNNSRERFNNEVDTRATPRSHYGTGVSLKLLRGRPQTSASARSVWFRPGPISAENLASSFDSRIELVEAGVGYALTPFTSLSLNLTHERQRFVHPGETPTIRVMPTDLQPLGC